MRKSLLAILLLAVVFASLCVFTACDDGNNGENYDLDKVVLTDELVHELQQASYDDYPNSNLDALTIRFCLGSVNGKIVFAFDADTPDFQVIQLGGQIAGLPYEQMYPLRVYADSKTVLLPDAYEQGLITQAELEKILAAFWGTDDWTYVQQHSTEIITIWFEKLHPER